MFTRITNRRLSECVRLATLAALLGAVLAAPASADVFVSVQNGAWDAPATWGNPFGPTPGPDDDVIIAANTTVGLVSSGGGLPVREVKSLTVMPLGKLQPQYPAGSDGRNMYLRTNLAVDLSGFDPNDPGGLWIDPTTINPLTYVPTIPLLNFGTIGGEDGEVRGGSVFLSTAEDPNGFPLAAWCQNQGTIAGGSGEVLGGNVVIFYANGVAANFGTIAGGDDGLLGTGLGGGTATVFGAYVSNETVPSVVTGSTSGGDSIAGSGGSAFFFGISNELQIPATARNANNCSILGGSGSTLDSGTHRGGGDAGIIALGTLGTSTASNFDGATIRGGDGCEGGDAWLMGGLTYNSGTVATGQTQCDPMVPPRNRIEPPDGLIEGDADISGYIVEFAAGSSLTLALNARTGADAPVRAEADMSFTLAVGGTLDLSGCDVSGGALFEAGGSITIHAETILVPDPNIPEGVPALNVDDLHNLMGAAVEIIWTPAGAPYRLLYAGPDGDYGVEPDETFELPIVIANLGNTPEFAVNYYISDSEGWLDPNFVGGTVFLTPIDGFVEMLVVETPAGAAPGDETIISVHVEAQDDPNNVFADAQIRLMLPDSGCLGDLDGDGDVDLADLARLLANYGTSSGAAYEDGDLDGDGDVDLSDLAQLLANYGCSQ